MLQPIKLSSLKNYLKEEIGKLFNLRLRHLRNFSNEEMRVRLTTCDTPSGTPSRVVLSILVNGPDWRWPLCLFLWRLEGDIKCFPSSLSTLYFETGSFTKPQAQ